MIKIISYVVIAFFYRKTNILGRWSNILCIFNRNKGLLREQQSIGADYALLDLDENLHCIMWPLSSCYIKISVVSQCRILVAVQYMNTQLFSFFCNWQLAPAGLLCDLVTVDADWRRLNLLTDSRHTSLETKTQIWNWPRQLPHNTQLVHCLQIVHCWLHLMHQQWQNSCILSSCLMTTSMCKKCYLRDFKKLPNQNSIDIPMKTSKAFKFFVTNSKLSTNAHLVHPKDGRGRYVLFFKTTSKINSSRQYV